MDTWTAAFLVLLDRFLILGGSWRGSSERSMYTYCHFMFLSGSASWHPCGRNEEGITADIIELEGNDLPSSFIINYAGKRLVAVITQQLGGVQFLQLQ